jgi:hypothetical protein
MAEREPGMGRTSTLLASDVRLMSGPPCKSRTLESVSSSANDVRPIEPDMGRTWADRASPGGVAGVNPGPPAEPIEPDIAGRTSNRRARGPKTPPPIGDCNERVYAANATLPATGLPDAETKPTATQPNYGAVAMRPN